MKKIFGVLAFSTALLGSTALSGSAAFAGQNEDLVARLNAAEKENATIRRSNMDLAAPKPASVTDRMADFFGTYAADLPVAYRARPAEQPGQFRIWVEGGAIWSGGDPETSTFIQAGVSYWFTRNFKVGVSYRVDALISVKNTKSANAEKLLLPERYWHGPLLTLTGQF